MCVWEWLLFSRKASIKLKALIKFIFDLKPSIV